jgi:hypothetical protein
MFSLLGYFRDKAQILLFKLWFSRDIRMRFIHLFFQTPYASRMKKEAVFF